MTKTYFTSSYSAILEWVVIQKNGFTILF